MGRRVETEYLIPELEGEVEGLKGASELNCFRKEGWKPSKTKSGHNVTQFDIPRGNNRDKAPGLFRVEPMLIDSSMGNP